MRHPRINVLCVVGAMVGLSCLLTTWALVTETPPGWPTSAHSKSIEIVPDAWSPIDTLAAAGDPLSTAYGSSELVAFSILFVLGTALAFLTPLGGAPQLVGVLGFYTVSSEHLFVSEFTAGLVVATAAALIVLASLWFPLGVGYERGPVSLKSRLLTVTGL